MIEHDRGDAWRLYGGGDLGYMMLRDRHQSRANELCYYGTKVCIRIRVFFRFVGRCWRCRRTSTGSPAWRTGEGMWHFVGPYDEVITDLTNEEEVIAPYAYPQKREGLRAQSGFRISCTGVAVAYLCV